MKILKFPKIKKCPKLKIKIKCNECGTKLLIDNISDLTRICGIDAGYELDCPYCGHYIRLDYDECERVDQYRKYNAISIGDMDSREVTLTDFFEQRRHK